jgi:hypothetical protein
MMAAMVTTVSPCVLAESRDAEIEKMKAMMREMSKTIQTLQSEVAALKKEKAAEWKPAASRTAGAQVATPSSKVLPSNASGPPESAAHKSMLEERPVAPPGYIEIPGTNIILKPGGTVRLDAIYDSGRNGNPNEFIPSSFPIGGSKFDHDGRSQLHAKGSRLTLDVRHLGEDSKFHVYYENDFFADSTANAMSYRLRHFYGEAWNFLAGHTFSTFMDIDVYPGVLDYEGSNGLIYIRQPQIRYTYPFMHNLVRFAIAVEQANPQIDTDDTRRGTESEVFNRFPDITAHVRIEDQKWGHVQLSGIYRMFSYENDWRHDDTNGWGVSLSAGFKVFARDSFVVQATYGEGIARYVQDPSGLNLDAGLDEHSVLKAIPVFAFSVGYTHQWSEKWKSTMSYGYVSLEPEFSNGPTAFERSHYFAANLVYQPSPVVTLGLEYLYGIKEVANGEDADGHRLNLVIKYDLAK